LGRGICLELAKHGCVVAVADINLEAAEKTANELRNMGVKANAYKVDVSQSEEILKLRDDVKNDLGPVDILVCFFIKIRFRLFKFIDL
jgi:all-trans-retinol dehydrogenase (NAD+)